MKQCVYVFLLSCVSFLFLHCSQVPPENTNTTSNSNNTTSNNNNSTDGGTQTPKSCTLDSCPTDQVCDAQKGCVPACQSDKDCQSRRQLCILVSHRCVDCVANTDCSSGESCRRNQCFKDTTCRSSKDCPADQICDIRNERCVGCLGDHDCKKGFVCLQGVCDLQPPQCQSHKDCKPYGMVCDTNKTRCVDCMADADCDKNFHCQDNACISHVCQSGETRCTSDGKSIERCKTNGSGWAVEACAAGKSCKAGVCESSTVCTPGESRCAGNVVEHCKTDGLAWEKNKDCGTDATCEKGTCVTKHCKMGEVLCVGNILKTCDTSGNWADKPCATDEICQNNACKKQVCKPGTQECVDGKNARTCRTDGSDWDTTICASDQTCVAGSCQKQQQVCSPNAVTCFDANTAQTCKADGSGWVKQTCASNEQCQGGVCKTSSVCSPNAVTCFDANTTQTCKSDGSGWVKQTCASNEQCQGGVCKTSSSTCTPGTQQCLDTKTAQTCRTDGSGWNHQPCASNQTCQAGTCQTPLCSPNTVICFDANTAQTCKADGSGWIKQNCANNEQCQGGVCKASSVCSPNAVTCFDANTAQTCKSDGSGWLQKTCASNEQCQGGVCQVVGGTCQASQTRSCYSGPNGTMGIGICKGGTQTCQSNQTWGTCVGEQTPQNESCGNNLDDNCDGNIDEGCSLGFGVTGGGTSVDLGYMVRVDSKGNIYIFGAHQGYISFGGYGRTSSGDFDLYLVKLDSKGQFLWGRGMGGQYRDFPGGMDIDAAGNAYITGSFESKAVFGTTTLSASGSQDVFVARYDADGTFQWAIQGGGFFDDAGQGVAIDKTLDIVYVTGSFQGQVSFGLKPFTSKGARDIFLMKLTARGGVQWTVTAGGQGDDYATDVAVDSYGNAYMTGFFGQTASFGSTNVTANGSMDVFTAKVDPQGNFTRITGSVGGQTIAVDSTGNAYIAGGFTGLLTMGTYSVSSSATSDIYVVKLDHQGHVAWLTASQGTQTEVGRIAVDRQGQAHLNGSFTQTTKFGTVQRTSIGAKDTFVAKLDTTGKFVWATSGGGLGDDLGFSVTLDSQGNIFSVGSYVVSARFGTFSSQSKGASDVIVWQIPRP